MAAAGDNANVALAFGAGLANKLRIADKRTRNLEPVAVMKNRRLVNAAAENGKPGPLRKPFARQREHRLGGHPFFSLDGLRRHSVLIHKQHFDMHVQTFTQTVRGRARKAYAAPKKPYNIRLQCNLHEPDACRTTATQKRIKKTED